MGIIAILSLAVGAASAVTQYNASKKASRARIEANDISTANEKNKDRLQRRKVARQERIRRAQVAQTSENRGVAGSSGEIGSQSGLSAVVGSSLASQGQDVKTVEGINASNVAAANAQQSAQNAKLFGSLIQGGLGLFEDKKD